MSGWPWPGDNELTRARKIALAYRMHLRTTNPKLCDALDEAMRAYGQFWVLSDTPVVYEPTQAITADLAAELVSRSEVMIRRWACTPHPEDPGRMLLPRFGWDGARRTYLVADVLEAKRVWDARLTYRQVHADDGA